MTYIPSLPLGTPFILSLHSWTTPEFNNASLTCQSGVASAWAVTVLVDGLCASYVESAASLPDGVHLTLAGARPSPATQSGRRRSVNLLGRALAWQVTNAFRYHRERHEGTTQTDSSPFGVASRYAYCNKKAGYPALPSFCSRLLVVKIQASRGQ